MCAHAFACANPVFMVFLLSTYNSIHDPYYITLLIIRMLVAIASIRRVSLYLPLPTKRMLYNALVLPHAQTTAL